jgi:hypothetical protein
VNLVCNILYSLFEWIFNDSTKFAARASARFLGERVSVMIALSIAPQGQAMARGRDGFSQMEMTAVVAIIGLSERRRRGMN